MTWLGRFVAAASLVIEIEEVLLARIASGFIAASRSAKILSLSARSSVAASITRSLSLSADVSVAVEMRAMAASFCAAVILSLLISRSRLAPIVASPRCTCASLTSIITTSWPATANAWAMPLPIVPAPTTPILPIVIALVLRMEFGRHSDCQASKPIPLRMVHDFSG